MNGSDEGGRLLFSSQWPEPLVGRDQVWVDREANWLERRRHSEYNKE